VAQSQEKPELRASPVMEPFLSEAPHIFGPLLQIVKRAAILSSLSQRGVELVSRLNKA
jgi:hypothetical protein